MEELIVKDDLTAFWHSNKKVFGHATGFSMVFWAVALSINASNIALILAAGVMVLFIAAVCSKNAQTDTAGNELKKEVFDMWYELEPGWSLDAAGVISIAIFLAIMALGMLLKNKALPTLATFFS